MFKFLKLDTNILQIHQTSSSLCTVVWQTLNHKKLQSTNFPFLTARFIGFTK